MYKEKHPTGLHGFKPKKISDRKQGNGKDDNKPITNTCTGVRSLSCASTRFRSDIISMCVVPVQIFHRDSSEVLYTYAMLDNCIQGTFVKKYI